MGLGLQICPDARMLHIAPEGAAWQGLRGLALWGRLPLCGNRAAVLALWPVACNSLRALRRCVQTDPRSQRWKRALARQAARLCSSPPPNAPCRAVPATPWWVVRTGQWV